jgi:hypothetical protein
MPLSWNEIRHNAIRFARNHKDTASEQGERQTFWNVKVMAHPLAGANVDRGVDVEIRQEHRKQRG